ncbi:MAG TPA: non-canonical purine NTP pyrophosphatase [Gemmatimonadaceae bacterium]|nr:non-canonical purine NTP pyrophosphatase [Gemmatimonadaceae bacterium]
MSGQVFLLATRSAGKLRELREIFAELGLEITDVSGVGIPESAAEEQLECHETFEENALAKVRYFFEISGGLPTFGDDSGMCVDVLGREPGVYSKRWSARDDLDGEALDAANNAELVARMAAARRNNEKGFTDSARYVCVAAFKDAAGEEMRRGEIEGRVLENPRGSAGFGYDPYFEAPDLGGTFAESSMENTARNSHRSRAFRALLSALRAQGRI